eukprot:CAMPEP_0184378036 /NCGR_PEP_ID=MMETSP0007-20130409/2754_1 /TAXON_ID=97485 /ORGANISM="Prymnesium parvum, Strain Texoma1" /LENGTH=140 /DNA_ID=CAMNT_0026722155 /DNA_START=920 /DNA_END=1339 /DNA_ORIENTATION=+
MFTCQHFVNSGDEDRPSPSPRSDRVELVTRQTAIARGVAFPVAATPSDSHDLTPEAARAPRTLEEEVAAMTPNTMRQKLVEVLAAYQRGADAGVAAGTPTQQPSPMRTAHAPPPSRRISHSGQLGGLFARESAPTLPHPS